MTAANYGWLALKTASIFIFDVHSDPAKPRYAKTIDNFEKSPEARSDLTALTLCRGACSFRASRTRRITEAGLHSSNTAMTATTSPPTGCQQKMTRGRDGRGVR